MAILRSLVDIMESQTDQNAAARQKMVAEQLERRGIRDPRVLAAMAKVRRDLFVAAEEQEAAYADRALSIECGQTISQPYIVALMTEALELAGTEMVLEIGTGSGYQTAVLCELARHVKSIERHAELSERSRYRASIAVLRKLYPDCRRWHLWLARKCSVRSHRRHRGSAAHAAGNFRPTQRRGHPRHSAGPQQSANAACNSQSKRRTGRPRTLRLPFRAAGGKRGTAVVKTFRLAGWPTAFGDTAKAEFGRRKTDVILRNCVG